MNPAEWLRRSAALKPQNPALFHGEALVADYAEFARRAAAIAGANTQSTPKIRSGIPKTTGPYLANMINLPELIIRIGTYSLWMTCRCKARGKKKPRFGGAFSWLAAGDFFGGARE